MDKREAAATEVPVASLDALVSHSKTGHHLLFDESAIRRGLAAPMPSSDHEQVLAQVDLAWRGLLGEGSVHEKREFLSTFPESVQNVCVKLYFRWMDQFAVRERALH